MSAQTISDGRTIAIVGGGASGTLTAIDLLRTGGPNVHVVLIEATGYPGYGVAYSTPDERHLLNVRAGNMSGFPDQPSDLLDWAAQVGRPLDPADFLPRKEYALYLRDRLFAAADDRFETVAARVTDIEPADGGGYLLSTADGPTVFADAVVLAYGNQAPGALQVNGQALPEAPWHIANPWKLGWIDTLPADATVVLVGTGLTAIDTAITVLERDPSFRVVMVSRHGVPEGAQRRAAGGLGDERAGGPAHRGAARPARPRPDRAGRGRRSELARRHRRPARRHPVDLVAPR